MATQTAFSRFQPPAHSPEVQAIQKEQNIAYNLYYDALNAAFKKAGTDQELRAKALQDPAVVQAQAVYDRTVEQLLALLGTDASCDAVDTMLFSDFSDCYKEYANFRPRHHVTRAECLEYLASKAIQPTA